MYDCIIGKLMVYRALEIFCIYCVKVKGKQTYSLMKAEGSYASLFCRLSWEDNPINWKKKLEEWPSFIILLILAMIEWWGMAEDRQKWEETQSKIDIGGQMR